jgi:hypothetical protein
MARQYTNQLLEMIEQGLVSESSVVLMCMNYMSEDDVKDMMECNDLIDESENDDA